MIAAIRALTGIQRYIGAGLVVALIAVCAWAWRVDSLRASYKQQVATEKAAHDKTIADFASAMNKARADNLATVRRVEAEQAAITEKVRTDYAQAIADVRARYDAIRLRLTRNQGAAGKAGVSQVPDTASGIDGAAGENGLPAEWALEDRLLATEIALRLEALQAWVREQVAVDPNAVKE